LRRFAQGRWRGAVAHDTPIAVAKRLGAARLVVLPFGFTRVGAHIVPPLCPLQQSAYDYSS